MGGWFTPLSLEGGLFDVDALQSRMSYVIYEFGIGWLDVLWACVIQSLSSHLGSEQLFGKFDVRLCCTRFLLLPVRLNTLIKNQPANTEHQVYARSSCVSALAPLHRIQRQV